MFFITAQNKIYILLGLTFLTLNQRGEKMDHSIKINSQLMQAIKEIVNKTKMFHDEEDFINQAILKQISKFRGV